MIPVTEMTEEQLAYWGGQMSHLAVFTSRADPPGCVPCVAVVTYGPGGDERPVVRAPWKPDEIEMAHLVAGGTIWLSCWGGLPPHSLEVQPGHRPDL